VHSTAAAHPSPTPYFHAAAPAATAGTPTADNCVPVPVPVPVPVQGQGVFAPQAPAPDHPTPAPHAPGPSSSHCEGITNKPQPSTASDAPAAAPVASAASPSPVPGPSSRLLWTPAANMGPDASAAPRVSRPSKGTLPSAPALPRPDTSRAAHLDVGGNAVGEDRVPGVMSQPCPTQTPAPRDGSMHRLVTAALEYRTHAAQLRHTSQFNHVRAVEEVALLARDVHAHTLPPTRALPPAHTPSALPVCASAADGGHSAGARLAWGAPGATDVPAPPPPVPRPAWQGCPEAEAPAGAAPLLGSPPPFATPRLHHRLHASARGGAVVSDAAAMPTTLPTTLGHRGSTSDPLHGSSPGRPHPAVLPAPAAPSLHRPHVAGPKTVEVVEVVSVPPPAPRTGPDALAFARQAALQAAYRQRHGEGTGVGLHAVAEGGRGGALGATPHLPQAVALPGTLPVSWTTPVRQPHRTHEELVPSAAGAVHGGSVGLLMRLSGGPGISTSSRRPRACMLPPAVAQPEGPRVPEGPRSEGESGPW
jgi:hypothetical protein